MTTNHYRQGDVLIEQVQKVPAKAQPQKPSKRIVLAHGEVTGHHHALETRDPADWWKTADSPIDEQFVRVKNGASIVHQEHAPIELEPGTYRVTRQREYSPEEIRRVAD